MNNINLPHIKYKRKNVDGKTYVFDPYRQAFVLLTLEENVRQHLIAFLISHRDFPKSLIAVERKLVINKQEFRFDVLCYNKKMKPRLLVECKAPNIKISQGVFDQVVKYNLGLKAEYVCVSNGIEHYICKMDYNKNTYKFLKDFPYFEE
ncbi:MAG: type I restriction enzyme HsdR N-terminal domain-containing protein [Bacteroidales bacterium]